LSLKSEHDEKKIPEKKLYLARKSMRKTCSSEEEHETLKKISRAKFVSEEHEIIYMHLRSTRRSQQLPPPESSKNIILHFSRLDIFAESANPEFKALILVAAAK
jgi:hypothetical protein